MFRISTPEGIKKDLRVENLRKINFFYFLFLFQKMGSCLRTHSKTESEVRSYAPEPVYGRNYEPESKPVKNIKPEHDYGGKRRNNSLLSNYR